MGALEKKSSSYLSGRCAIVMTTGKKKNSSRLSGGCSIIITTRKKSSSHLSGGCAIIITTGKKVLVVCLAGALEKKSSSHLSGGSAIVITTGKKSSSIVFGVTYILSVQCTVVLLCQFFGCSGK